MDKATQQTKEISVPIQAQEETMQLLGNLTIPEHATGIVLFAHGSGSSRWSPRNQAVAELFQEGHLATLLIDLLSVEEEEEDLRTRELRFDIPMLTQRFKQVVDWVHENPPTKDFRVGAIGSSTGAAAALIAAADRPAVVKAVVSRGGRPDLAAAALPNVSAPTLLIVGGHDLVVLELNREAFDLLDCERQLEVIPGATHLFEEPGTLEQAAKKGRDWFVHHLKH